MESVRSFVHTSVGPVESGDRASGGGDFRIKIALIDDGVDVHQVSKGLVSSKGWPLTEPTSEDSPFYRSATGHGTTMAKLMRAMCPRIEVFVAKLGEWKDQGRVDWLKEVSTAKNAALVCMAAVSPQH